jgi:hypothetical protein
VLEADDEGDDIEIVDHLPIDDAIDESPDLPETSVAEGPPDEPRNEAPDPFATFVLVVDAVARTAGAGVEAMTLLGAILGRARLDASAGEADRSLRAQALAWQAILRGESEDFAACGGGMLDDWTAALVAHVLAASGSAHRADALKRELRRHGVAAFGLVEQAA